MNCCLQDNWLGAIGMALGKGGDIIERTSGKPKTVSQAFAVYPKKEEKE